MDAENRGFEGEFGRGRLLTMLDVLYVEIRHQATEGIALFKSMPDAQREQNHTTLDWQYCLSRSMARWAGTFQTWYRGVASAGVEGFVAEEQTCIESMSGAMFAPPLLLGRSTAQTTCLI